MNQNPITKILFYIKDNLALLIPLFLLAGFVKGCFYPSEPTLLTSIIAVFVMILPVFINLELKDGLNSIKVIQKRFLFIALVLNFIFYPLLALFLGWMFLQNQPAMWLGLVLLSLIPTGSMSVNWTYFTKGNILGIICLVNVCLLFTLFYLPVVMPYFSDKLGSSDGIAISNLDILYKILTVIIIPLVLGFFIRSIILKYSGIEAFEKIKPINSSISCVGILLICFIIMSYDRTQILVSKYDMLLVSLVPLIIFYIIVFALSHFSGRIFLDKDYAKALFFGTAPKYHVIMLAIVLNTYQNSELLNSILLMIIIAMVLQIPALAFYARFIVWYDNKQDLVLEQEKEYLDEKYQSS